jgi:hypothetical protein
MTSFVAENLEILKELVREFDRGARSPSGTWQVYFLFERRPSPDKKAKLFESEDTGGRTIWLYRDDESLCDSDDAIEGAAKSPNPAQELASVSHELGHHYVWIGQKLPNEGSRPREIEYAEEVLAWTIGRNILAARGFEEWKRFDEEQERSLATYRDGFEFSREKTEQIAAEILSRHAELIDRSRWWPGPRAGHQ